MARTLSRQERNQVKRAEAHENRVEKLKRQREQQRREDRAEMFWDSSDKPWLYED